jgi:hypothetical protein
VKSARSMPKRRVRLIFLLTLAVHAGALPRSSILTSECNLHYMYVTSSCQRHISIPSILLECLRAFGALLHSGTNTPGTS